MAFTGLTGPLPRDPATGALQISVAGGVAQTFTTQQTFKLDVVDPGANIVLDNLTPISTHGGPPYKKSAITWFRDEARKWIAGLDVGNGSYGSGSDIRDDFYLLHHWAPDTTKSADVLYLTDEQDPRVGIMQNTPVAQLHVSSRKANRPVLSLNHAENVATDQWIQTFERLGGKLGGFWVDSAATVPLKLGIGVSVEPLCPLDVRGRAQVKELQPYAAAAAFLTAEAEPLIYTAAGGGSAPFDQSGNLIIQPRSTAARSVTIAPDATIANATTFDSTGAITLKADVWHKDRAGAERIQFAGGGALYSKAPVTAAGTAAHIWRNGSDANIMRLLGTGALNVIGDLDHDGAAVGFFGTAPIAKPTGVAVTAAGIHAALVSLGLIAA